MSTLVEIEAAAEALPPEQQRELLRFLWRIVPVSDAALPQPRLFSDEEIESWLKEDREGMQRFREGA